MPAYNVSRNERPSPVKASPARPPAAWSFPPDHHLLITTQKHVISWDKDGGLKPIFTSGSEGILAAKEAKDDGALLAIADSQVVLLHDVHGTAERTYRLKGTDGQVRLLEYASDAAVLFFTTTLQNAVQIYSLQKSCLLDPAHAHPSPPTVLATTPKTSKSSQLLISCSESPPTIFLQNLTFSSAPVLLQPAASSSPVEVAAFHPERPHIFVLGFRDGTLAAYDATRISAAPRTARSHARQPAEISHFKKLHGITPWRPLTTSQEQELGAAYAGAVRSCSVSITGVSFLTGYKTRAVSVGADGKCRIVDFDFGGKILRTWHAKAPATSLSVLSLRSPSKGRDAAKAPRARPFNRSFDGSNDLPDHIIAVGRQDGKVLMFNSLGLLLGEETVDTDGRTISQLDWLNGPTTRPAAQEQMLPDNVIDAPALKQTSRRKSGIRALRKSRSKFEMAIQEPTSVEQALEPSLAASANYHTEWEYHPPDEEPAEDFDEMSGTVNYNPIEGPVTRELPQISNTNYMDLFSPVKKPPSPHVSPQRRPIRRVRPRLRSSTFNGVPFDVESSPARIQAVQEGTSQMELEEPVETINTERHQENSNDPPTPAKTPRQSAGPEGILPASYQPDTMGILKLSLKPTPRVRKGRRISFRRTPGAYVSSQSSLATSMATSEISQPSSAQLFSDLKRIQETGLLQKRGKLAFFAPYMPKPSVSSIATTPSDPNPPDITRPKSNHPSSEQQQPADILAAPSEQKAAQPADDIWFTSDEEAVQHRPYRSRAGIKKRRSRASRVSIMHPFEAYNNGHSRRQSARYHSGSYSDKSVDEESQQDVPLSPSRPSAKELGPGLADSPQGPMEVSDYFPRGSSLAHGDSGYVGDIVGHGEFGKSITGEVDEPRASCACNGVCCGPVRSEMEALREEMRVLRREMAEMKELLLLTRK